MYHQYRKGWIEVISGCMFAGKTEELIRRINVLAYGKLNIMVFKPCIDNRYSEEEVVSHNGRKIKSIPPIFKIIPQVMRTRADSEAYYSYDMPIIDMDEYISKKDEEGIKISYMNIIYAAMVRLLAQKPQLNRFVMNCETYARNDIEISFIEKEIQRTT